MPLPETIFVGVTPGGNLYTCETLREAIDDGCIDVACYLKQKPPKKPKRVVKYYLVEKKRASPLLVLQGEKVYKLYLCVDYTGRNCFSSRPFAFRFSPEELGIAREAAEDEGGTVKVVYKKERV